jgi:uncharacterized protein (TIGR03437 family)
MSAIFTVRNGSTPAGTATVVASLGGSSKQFNLTTLGSLSISSLNCSPTVIAPGASGNCTVTMSQPGGSIPVSIVSSNQAGLSAPTTVTVPAGGQSVAFKVNAASSFSGSVSLWASYAGTWKNLVVAVGASKTVSAVSCPEGLSAGATGQCELQLTEDAPNGGTTLSLHSDNANLQVPEQVVVPAGRRSAAFAIRSVAFDRGGEANLIASSGAEAAAARISLDSVKLTSVSCAAKMVRAGEQVRCEVRLNAAQPSGVEIELSSSVSAVKLPGVVRTRAGQSMLSFQVEAAEEATQQNVTVEARLGGNAVQEQVTVLAADGPVVKVPETQYVRPGEEVRFNVLASDGHGLPVRITAGKLPAGAAFDAAGNGFSWTAGTSQMGSHEVTFTAVNAAHASRTATVRIEVGTGQPVAERLVNAASQTGGQAACSPGARASILGKWLLQGQAVEAPGGASELGGTRVKVNGEAAQLVFASGTRVDMVCPSLAAGSPLQVTVETEAGVSQAVQGRMVEAGPAIFTVDGTGHGQGQVVATGTEQFSMVRNYRYAGAPAQAGDSLSMRVTGLPAAGMPGRAVIGGVDTVIESVQAVAGMAGVSEVQVRVPEGVAAGEQTAVALEFRGADGQVLRSNTVSVAVEPALP